MAAFNSFAFAGSAGIGSMISVDTRGIAGGGTAGAGGTAGCASFGLGAGAGTAGCSAGFSCRRVVSTAPYFFTTGRLGAVGVIVTLSCGTLSLEKAVTLERGNCTRIPLISIR